MLKKLVLSFLMMAMGLIGAIDAAFAQVDVNKATQATLEGVKGIGPSTSQKILDARAQGGPFKNWPDLTERVKGIGDKTAIKLSDAGLTVNGHSLPNAGVVPSFAAKAKDGGADVHKTQPAPGPRTAFVPSPVAAATPTPAVASTSTTAHTSTPAAKPAPVAPSKAPESSMRPAPPSPLFPSSPPASGRASAPGSTR